jgi:hypothetical protein
MPFDILPPWLVFDFFQPLHTLTLISPAHRWKLAGQPMAPQRKLGSSMNGQTSGNRRKK